MSADMRAVICVLSLVELRSTKRAHSKNYVCQYLGCGRPFPSDAALARHEQSHLNLKPFSCTWPACEYSLNRRGDEAAHVRVVHFKLPRNVTEQKRRNIVDHRDPNEYIEMNPRLVARRLNM